jgi:imidazolonepropionase-like amidohydrolase
MRGFTTVRDMGGPAFSLKRAIDQGLVAGPRIYPSGATITITGGHGDFRELFELPRSLGGLTRAEHVGGAMIADSPDEVRMRSREQLMPRRRTGEMTMRRTRMGRPGLFGTMARTAMIAGTATAVANRVTQAQVAGAQQRAAAEQARVDGAVQAAPVASAPASTGLSDESIARLQKLAELQKAGVLTPEEFATQKARILGS